MPMEIFAVLISSLSALLGSLITGLITYKLATRKDSQTQTKNHLLQAYQDISSFYDLEKLYIEEIARLTEMSDESVKRRLRKTLRESGKDSPSEYTSPVSLSRAIAKLQ